MRNILEAAWQPAFDRTSALETRDEGRLDAYNRPDAPVLETVELPHLGEGQDHAGKAVEKF